MTATLTTKPAAYVPSWTVAETETRAYGIGPRSRIHLTGHADEPTVRTALTAAWRHAGQPIIVVVTPGMSPTERVAADWAAEHACAGIGLEVRHTTLASYPPVQELVLDGPARCRGCESVLCPDCRGGAR